MSERLRDRLVATAVFCGALAVFLVSPFAEMTDSWHSLLLTETLLTERTVNLDRHFALPLQNHQWQIQRVHGHFRYWYPAGSSILSLPIVALMRPLGLSCLGADGHYDRDAELRQQRAIASLLMAALTVVFFLTARLVLPWRWSLALTVAAALGTQVWSTASRVLWSDTWAIALGGGAAYVLLRIEAGRGAPRPMLLATLLSWMYFARPTTWIFIVGVTAFVAWKRRREFLPYAVTGALWFGAFAAFYLATFGRIVPDYHRYGFTLGGLPLALAGHLVSPSRGLLVGVPAVGWVAWALVRYRASLPHRELAIAAASSVGGYILFMSAWECWWGGPSYGPRLLTAAVPWIVLLGALAIAAARAAERPATRVAWALAIALAGVGIAVHGRGASSRETHRWNFHPYDIDEDPMRAWDARRPQVLAGWGLWDDGPGSRHFRYATEERLRRGDAAGALPLLDECVRRYPRSVSAYLLRGAARHAVGDHDGERSDFERAIAINPLLPEPYHNRALAREERADLDGALRDYGEAIRRQQVFAPPLRNRALLLMRRRDWAGARRDLDVYLNQETGPAEAWAERAVARSALGDLDGALLDLDESLRLGPGNREVRLLRGETREQRGDLRGALEDYRTAAEGAPGSWPQAMEVARRIADLERRVR